MLVWVGCQGRAYAGTRTSSVGAGVGVGGGTRGTHGGDYDPELFTTLK